MKTLALAALLLAPAGALAQEGESPSLDELLGLPEAEATDPAPEGEPQRQQIELDVPAGGDPFEQAVTSMDEAAARLRDAQDAGLPTQRLQEEAIKHLDQLIAQAQKNQSSSSSSSSSGSDAQRQQDTGSSQNNTSRQGEQQAGQQQGQQGSQQQQGGATAGNAAGQGVDGEGSPTGESQELFTNRETWGNLPPRVRDELMQGLSDRYSSVYQRLTEAYYKKLAQDAEDQ